MTNCLDCTYAKFEYDNDGYTPLVVCRRIGFFANWSNAHNSDCKSYIKHKQIIASRDDIRYYIIDYLADRFLRSTEGIGPNSLLSEFPITSSELANVLSYTFAVTIPEAKYSRWQTLEQAVNTTYSAQYFRLKKDANYE